MTWMPFLCLGTGLLINLKPMSPVIFKLVDNIINVPLVALITGVILTFAVPVILPVLNRIL